MQTGKIFDIKKYAIHDGPGIRTTVFFKGCPLSCWWCHNPESISPTNQRLYRRERCIGCNACEDGCPEGAVQASATGPQWNPSDCVFCGTCARRCPSEAVEFIGKTMTVDAVVAEITKDIVFYDESRGGVTISGGEPLMQPTFLIALLEACGELDLHRTVDTSGFGDTQALLKTAACTELFLYDLKHMDPEKHYRFTGVSNEKILTNLKHLSRQGAEVVIRFPVIPGFNSDERNIHQTGAFVSSLPDVRRVNILPYHCAAVAKYRNLALGFKTTDVRQPSREYLESVARRLENYGLEVKIGG
ncbi:MAG: glycyl-radical enzyme activating protein [Desulfobacterales bacterium]|nr:MAG: glycyl-radical enzyme activating protein [Desulfobacterales bacterium]